MKMKNSNYWINRSNQRMYEYLSDSEKVSAEIAKAYRRSERYIKSETDKIFQNFVGYTGISEADARILLKTSIGQTAADKLKSAISSVSDENIRKQMLAEINTPAYQARIKRLEELNSNIVNECNKLYGTELKLSTGLYTDIADKAFSRTIYDIQKGTGIGYSFAQIPKSRIDEILRNNWSGKHYSQRIWGNTQKLADNLKEDLLSGILSGKSCRKIAEDIAKRYNVSIYNAERLVRTETNYIANQAEIESYKESGIEKYRFVATLDSRTSEICQQLDGQEFSVSDAQAGVNLPPMHAHCRSTTISVISEKCLENLERRAKNPDGTTSKVPADMTYKEWKKQYVDVIGESRKNKKPQPITDVSINKVAVLKSNTYSEEQNKIIQLKHKELLEFARNENPDAECAFIFSSDFKNQVKCLGETSILNFSSREAVNMLIYERNLYVMHNHPKNSLFSMNDIRFFIEHETVKTLSIVNHNGAVLQLTKSEKYDSMKAREELKKSIIKYVKNGTDKEIDKAIKNFICKKELFIYETT